MARVRLTRGGTGPSESRLGTGGRRPLKAHDTGHRRGRTFSRTGAGPSSGALGQDCLGGGGRSWCTACYTRKQQVAPRNQAKGIGASSSAAPQVPLHGGAQITAEPGADDGIELRPSATPLSPLPFSHAVACRLLF